MQDLSLQMICALRADHTEHGRVVCQVLNRDFYSDGVAAPRPELTKMSASHSDLGRALLITGNSGKIA